MSQSWPWAGYTYKDESMWKAHFVCVPSQNNRVVWGYAPQEMYISHFWGCGCGEEEMLKC